MVKRSNIECLCDGEYDSSSSVRRSERELHYSNDDRSPMGNIVCLMISWLRMSQPEKHALLKDQRNDQLVRSLSDVHCCHLRSSSSKQKQQVCESRYWLTHSAQNLCHLSHFCLGVALNESILPGCHFASDFLSYNFASIVFDMPMFDHVVVEKKELQGIRHQPNDRSSQKW
jgi:hypothetical protein